MTEAFAKRPLNSVLRNGEVICHFTRTGEFYAEYRDGQLHPFVEKVRKNGSTVKVFETDNIFDSATSFCNFHVKCKVNGWREARVLRDGQWLRLGKLEPIEEHKVVSTIIVKEEMPPRKATNYILKTKKTEAILPPIVATTIESSKDPIEVESFDEVSLTSIKIGDIIYYLDANKKKLYEKLADKSIGRYIGRYNAKIVGKIDRSITDSDDEEDNEES